MKDREMKRAKEVIEKGDGRHMYTMEQLLFRLSIKIWLIFLHSFNLSKYFGEFLGIILILFLLL